MASFWGGAPKDGDSFWPSDEELPGTPHYPTPSRPIGSRRDTAQASGTAAGTPGQPSAKHRQSRLSDTTRSLLRGTAKVVIGSAALGLSMTNLAMPSVDQETHVFALFVGLFVCVGCYRSAYEDLKKK